LDLERIRKETSAAQLQAEKKILEGGVVIRNRSRKKDEGRIDLVKRDGEREGPGDKVESLPHFPKESGG